MIYKSCIALILLMILFFTSAAISKPRCSHDATTFRCVEYVGNYDGDTITVNIPKVHDLLGKKIGVRVLGIDTPEIKGSRPCEKELAKAAQKLVGKALSKAKRIDLINIGRDKYFRIDADVIVDGVDLKGVLIKSDFAVPYDGGTKPATDWCKLIGI